MNITQIRNIERYTSIAGIFLILAFSALGMLTALIILIGVGIALKIWIYTKYKEQAEEDVFWSRYSKPVMASLVIITLLVIMEHYNVFQIFTNF